VSDLPRLSRLEFDRRLDAASSSTRLDELARERLFAHFEELRRWADRLDLVGPGAATEIVERHYAEAIAALPWLPVAPARLVDLGSGAGFPGLVLAAARPDLEVTLVEPRERRAAFLSAAARKMRLAVRVVNARVEAKISPDIPSEIDVLSVRALRLEPRLWRALQVRLAPGCRLLSWSGEQSPELPPAFVAGRDLLLAGSARRHLREYLVAPEAS
jgi:16S rRNA (guanine527-N7)-methyltransferase